ncbi:ATP-dependent DNA ligase [Candidatus Daviesbacteria bacterium]|nr:ATP-dependent DNA ligase [Candidatus Daviesbacteria bacterium]
MTFSELAQYLEKLEQTSSRLALIDILSELFSQVSFDEIGHVSYLIQGRVAPFFEPLEIGMSEKLVAASIARVYGIDKENVLKEYGKVGDLGLVAQKLNEQTSKRAKEKLTVNEVFETLRSIAKMSGEGTVEKKVSTLAELLKKVGAVGAKHLVRIPLGVSRLGVGDPTILDAFAKLKLGDKNLSLRSRTLTSDQRSEHKSKRKLLEGAYNRTSDLGLIGETLWSKGLAGVEKLAVTVGRPIRSQLAERLPTPEKVIEKLGEVNVQRKLDGFRVQIHKEGDSVRLFSRNLEETTPMFPEIAEGVRKQIKAKSVILDCEAIGFNPISDEFLPFQETTQRRRKYGIDEMAKKIPLKAFCFDVLYKDGKSLIDSELKERLKILEKTVEQGTVLMVEEGETVKDTKKLQDMLDDAISKGLEGLVVKRLDSKYEAGARNFNWVKLKRHSNGELKDTIDCVILGYAFGKGKRAEFGAGALLVGVYDQDKDMFVTVSKIGTGLTDEEWRSIEVQSAKFKVQNKPARIESKIIPSVWVEPKIVIEVLADEITKSPLHTAGLALRFPRLVKFREEDKKPEDATTLKELEEMYGLQFKK